jgi:hypothetical protein
VPEVKPVEPSNLDPVGTAHIVSELAPGHGHDWPQLAFIRGNVTMTTRSPTVRSAKHIRRLPTVVMAVNQCIVTGQRGD